MTALTDLKREVSWREFLEISIWKCVQAAVTETNLFFRFVSYNNTKRVSKRLCFFDFGGSTHANATHILLQLPSVAVVDRGRNSTPQSSSENKRKKEGRAIRPATQRPTTSGGVQQCWTLIGPRAGTWYRARRIRRHRGKNHPQQGARIVAWVTTLVLVAFINFSRRMAAQVSNHCEYSKQETRVLKYWRPVFQILLSTTNHFIRRDFIRIDVSDWARSKRQ